MEDYHPVLKGGSSGTFNWEHRKAYAKGKGISAPLGGEGERSRVVSRGKPPRAKIVKKA